MPLALEWTLKTVIGLVLFGTVGTVLWAIHAEYIAMKKEYGGDE